MATTEDVTNGVATPPIAGEASVTSSSSVKRKRADSGDAPATNGTEGKSLVEGKSIKTNPKMREVMLDICVVLRR